MAIVPTDAIVPTESEPVRFASSLIPLIPSSRINQVEDALGLADEEAELEGSNKGYVSRIFTQVALPYKDPLKNDPSLIAWERRNGNLVMRVEPALITSPSGDLSREFPFGKYPRLILPWVTTNIVLGERAGARRGDGTMEIALADSLPEFLADLGQSWSGGKGAILRAQVQRLFGARFSVTETAQTAGGMGVRGASYQVAKGFQLWWGKRDGDLAQDGLWGNSVVVSSDFVSDVLDCPIPIDLKAVSVLAKSGPMAMDMYAWLNYRLPAARRSSLIPWEALNLQFGAQYKLTRQFKARFLKQLPAVRMVYPAAHVEPTGEGLIIWPSPPAVPFSEITD